MVVPVSQSDSETDSTVSAVADSIEDLAGHLLVASVVLAFASMLAAEDLTNSVDLTVAFTVVAFPTVPIGQSIVAADSTVEVSAGVVAVTN